MRHDSGDIRHNKESKELHPKEKNGRQDDFVLEKNIFSNVFQKDIRRVYIYKKAERLAKALHMISPAFSEAVSLKNRIDAVALKLVDAAIAPPAGAHELLSRELLALSSLLSIARTNGMLSTMNADLIVAEAHQLLQEIASYEEPRLFLEAAPTLSELAKKSNRREERPLPALPAGTRVKKVVDTSKGHIKDTTKVSDRREAVLSIISSKSNVNIKDISTLIRDVSEKTIQRELQALIEAGVIQKQGERRWSTYSLV